MPAQSTVAPRAVAKGQIPRKGLWLQANRVAPDTTIDLDLPELGAEQ